MSIDFLSAGEHAPEEVNAVIEVPKGGVTIKYEIDKRSGFLNVDRRLRTPLFYPANYGFIPQTLSQDGDALDILVIGREALVPGCMIISRPIGVLMMEDEAGRDEKILAVPVSRIDPYYDSIETYLDVPAILMEEITHFFDLYKTLEPEKWCRVDGWEGKDKAQKLILEAMKQFKAKTIEAGSSPGCGAIKLKESPSQAQIAAFGIDTQRMENEGG